jgi:hypothetical protein
MSMTTSANLSSEKMHEYGIDRVHVEFEVERVHRESYHRAGQITEIVEVTGLDGCLHPREKLNEVALKNGYDDVMLFLWETHDEKINRVAMEEGPEMEAAQYSDYMARKAESDWH